MNTTLREALAEQINAIDPAHLDVDELVGLGERRLRRRRLTAAWGAAAAVVLVIALAVAGAALSGSSDHGSAPTDNRTTDGDKENNSPSRTRPLVYSDVRFPGHPDSRWGHSIHVGDRVVKTGALSHLDVTDDGVVYTTGGYREDGRVWFTDGGTPERIGSHACAEGHGWPGTVATGASGSLAAWFDCTRTQDPELVVYDTSSGREVVRRQIPGCGCLPGAIIGDHVFFNTYDDGFQSYFDMATDRVRKVKPVIPFGEGLVAQSYLDDIASQRRSLVIGDSWETGTPTLSADFDVVGTRLVSSSDGSLTSVFDTATHRPIRLRLPPGYQAHHDELGNVDFQLFEWLDDDTIALRGSGQQDGDILTCRLSNGRCELAVPAVPGYDRVVTTD